MSAAPLPKAYDPREEQRARLQQVAEKYGHRLLESFNDAVQGWLGPGLAVQLESCAPVEQLPDGAQRRVALEVALLGGETLRVLADLEAFFKFYEAMLSGGQLGTAVRRLGPTECRLGADLGWRWAKALPGIRPLEGGSGPIVRDADEAPPIPAKAWPLLHARLRLQGEGGDKGAQSRDEGAAQCIDLLIPMSVLQGAVAVHGGGQARQLYQAPVRLKAVLGQVRLRLKDLHELKEGDCVILDSGPDDEMVLHLSHQPAFKARPGRQGRHLAAQVTGYLNQAI